MALIDEQESFMATRSRGLGGSDIAAILGMSNFKTPIEVWQAKVDPDSIPEVDSEILWFGNALEPVIRERYAMKHGLTIIQPAHIGEHFPNSTRWKGQTMVTGREPWMLGTADGWIPSETAGFEAKNVGFKRKEDWGAEESDEIPQQYMLQSHWYLDVYQAKKWRVGPLFSGNTLGSYVVKFDTDLARDVYTAAKQFWFEFVVAKVEPPIDQTESYGRYLARKFSLPTGKTLNNPTGELYEWADRLKQAQAALAAAEENEQLAKNHLSSMLGAAGYDAVTTDMGKVGFVRPGPQKTVDWRAIAENLAVQFRRALGQDAEKLWSFDTLIAAHTSATPSTPYLRAWWKK